jgi:hypothetical protein
MKNKKLLLIVLVSVLPFVLVAQTWNEVGAGGFSAGEAYFQNIEVYNDVPYVAYIDVANNKGATVMKFNGQEWESIGDPGFTGKIEYLDFEIDNGVLYVAFSDGNKVSVMKSNGSTWETVGSPEIASSDIVALTIHNEIPYIGFLDNEHGSRLSVKKLSGTEWEYVGTPGFSNLIYGVLDIVVGDNIYVGFRDSDEKASVMTYKNDTWSYVGSPNFGGYIDSYKFLAVMNNIPYLASWDDEARGMVYYWDGSMWAVLGNQAITTGQAAYLSIRFAPDGALYMVCNDQGIYPSVVVKKYEGESWTSVGETASKSHGNFCDIAFSSDGKPYITYKDDWYMRRTTVMKYDNFNNVDETAQKILISVSPNPAKDRIHFSGIKVNNNTKAKIFNTAGQLVLTADHIQDGIDISILDNGVYLIRLSENNTITGTSKVVVNRD